MSKFAIGIPTLNRADLLMPTLKKYAEDFPNTQIYVIDNGEQDLKNWVIWKGFQNISVFEEETNIGVAASWNKLCKHIFQEHEYALLLNDDIYLGYGEETVEMSIETNPKTLIQAQGVAWSIILINKELYEFVGDFDETFYPAYYEDSDYIYRMRLLGILWIVDSQLNPQVFLQSQTYEKSPDFVNEAMAENRTRYIKKWGGMPLLETYNKPYND